VLHVVDKLSTGGSPVHGLTRLLSWWLPLHDPGRVRASVACLRGPDEGEAALESAGLAVKYVGRRKYDTQAIPMLVRTVRDEKIDILHLHGYGGSTIGRICGWITGLPCIVHEHICDTAIPAHQRAADRALRSRTAAAIAISRPVADFLVGKRFIRAPDVRIVYSGVPLELFRQPPSGRWHRELGLPDSQRLVATVGRLHRSKGLAYFLQAAFNVAEKQGSLLDKKFKDLAEDVVGLVESAADLDPVLSISINLARGVYRYTEDLAVKADRETMEAMQSTADKFAAQSRLIVDRQKSWVI